LSGLLIEKDPFINSIAFKNYETFRKERIKIESVIEEKGDLSMEELKQFISLNSDFWEVYYLAGKYYYGKKFYKEALIKFEEALSKEITTISDRESIEKYIIKIKRKLNDS